MAVVCRSRVGIDFLWTDAGNSGRANYIYSMVNAFQTLDDDAKPLLVVFHLPDSPIERLRSIGYPYLQTQVLEQGMIPRFTPFRRAVNRVSRQLTGRNCLPLLTEVPRGMVDCILPCEHRNHFRRIERRIHWIVDFNCFRLPDLFTKESFESHADHIRQIIDTNEEIMLSSQDALNDFRSFFPEATNRIHVLPFAVGLPNLSNIDEQAVLSRFNIKRPYFITPNTFWPHKNHQVIVRAMRLCIDQGADFDFVFTGKEETYLGSDYAQEIRHLVKANGLFERIHFLGLVDRKKQVTLLRQSLSIVQPSKFEGWSTVVEEALALGVPLIVSNLAIHREQVGDTFPRFEPDDEEDLASNLLNIALNKGAEFPQIDYEQRIRRYGVNIQKVLSL